MNQDEQFEKVRLSQLKNIPDEELVESARDLLVEYMGRHSKTCTASIEECPEVASILAFIAHSIGANEHDLKKFPALLMKEDLECEGCGRLHESIQQNLKDKK